MKVTMKDVLNATPGLQALIQTKQPPGTAFKFLNLTNALNSKLEHYNKLRHEWIAELGEEVVKGKPEKHVPNTSANFPEFEKRFNELMAEEVELPGIEPIPFEKLGSEELEAAHMLSLGVFLAKPKEGVPA